MAPAHILLVDDLEENLLALEALLDREDITLHKAKNGPEALELLLKHEIALALIDVQMPEMDGFELAELMRGMDRTRTIPIIFVTAGASDEKRRFRGYEAGAVDFLQKPIEADILKRKANIFIEMQHQREALQAANTEAKEYAEALKNADRRKDEFMATLAHELRNPLSPLKNGLQILNSNPPEKTATELRAMMERQVTHIEHLVDDLLDMSRLSKGKLELRTESLTLQDAIQVAMEGSAAMIEAGKHTLHKNLPDAPLVMNGDATRLAQIISNLLNNAAKYTDDGGEIHLNVTTENNHAVISVTDNGIGIPEDKLNDIFELFTQMDKSRKQSQGGLGIGLSLVKQLTEMHNGEIYAHSDGLNQGSTFKLKLPLSEISKPSARPEIKDIDLPKSCDNAQLRILVVDDNIPSANTMGWMMETIGHSVILSHDGQDALQKARHEKPDVILMDIGLPEMNGYDVARALREEKDLSHITLIAQTGWGRKRDKERAQDAGFDHHLIKPLNYDELTHLLSGISPQARPA